MCNGGQEAAGATAWAQLSLTQRVEKVLDAPVGLYASAWDADGVDAALSRLMKMQATEINEQGLPDDVVDARLWPGAAASGWRVHALTKDGHYRYTSPAGARMGSKGEALSLRSGSYDEKKTSARQKAVQAAREE